MIVEQEKNNYVHLLFLNDMIKKRDTKKCQVFFSKYDLS